MVMPAMPTPFGWEVRKLMNGRKAESVEDLGLPEESEAILREHMRGENTTLPTAVMREIADALNVDWRNGSKESRELSSAACWFLFVQDRSVARRAVAAHDTYLREVGIRPE
jgi:urate oxidase